MLKDSEAFASAVRDAATQYRLSYTLIFKNNDDAMILSLAASVSHCFRFGFHRRGLSALYGSLETQPPSVIGRIGVTPHSRETLLILFLFFFCRAACVLDAQCLLGHAAGRRASLHSLFSQSSRGDSLRLLASMLRASLVFSLAASRFLMMHR